LYRVGAMAQTFPTTPEIVYNTLVADATFMALVGSYVFKANTSSIPAISIVTPGADMPDLKSIDGLEVVIHDTAQIRRMDFYGSTNIEKNWNLYVIAWGSATGDQVTSAVERIMRTFSGSSAMEVVATPDGLTAKVQTKVMIPSDKPVLVP